MLLFIFYLIEQSNLNKLHAIKLNEKIKEKIIKNLN